VHVLLRPPAEQSHYFAERSRLLYLDTLRYLARDERVVLILSPRYPAQVAVFREQTFANDPVVLDRPVPFVSLLKAVDLVLCSGGTMLREAAYLGIPAYSIFGSEIGAVDRHLESIGRVMFVTSPEELPTIRLEKSGGFVPLETNARLVDELAGVVMAADPEGSAAIT
jgi:predicted glycosyltransferase